MKEKCECGRELEEMYITAGGKLMVDCPEHGLHEWGEVKCGKCEEHPCICDNHDQEQYRRQV